MAKLICLTIFAFLVVGGSSLKCYTYKCESRNGRNCSANTDLKHLTCGIPGTGYQSICSYSKLKQNHYKCNVLNTKSKKKRYERIKKEKGMNKRKRKKTHKKCLEKGVSFGQTATNDLICYVCELQGTEACDDPFDRSQIASAACSSLVYSNRARQRDDETENPDELIKLDGKLRGAPVLNKIFHRNTSAEMTFKYVCVKIELESDGNRGIVRTCQRAWRDVADVCDFIKQELDPNVNLKNCNVCENDNCNAGSLFSASLLMVLISVILFTSGL
ncbi:hypothetical protein RN001_013402 [Aquatica leii]|uniref:Protein sleepless n=1 Tax=Aquatica leii TaxID=1421715 RepID=A0AAN7PRQ5_9COLE|nr:hypothetical protein RN001_013402 [Aquatica leii]